MSAIARLINRARVDESPQSRSPLAHLTPKAIQALDSCRQYLKILDPTTGFSGNALIQSPRFIWKSKSKIIQFKIIQSKI
ncbi:hypothetical protein IQ270_07350 [Microcoleus sp. LEGE 07076]|uniref:hypothetical protein n=1 Tax=Microcoleus sp. LEGE 07076 TaxID=915322 RepID=UPI00187E2686|nr:hypothetical protein [Microcoleus sp. LEGE 07076]MBE9184538.1 hypothetical protein [Microcoleus sp. LEGE 07076]